MSVSPQDVLEGAVLGCAAIALTCWLLSIVTREYSWVDRLWSIMPPVYVAWFAYAADFADLRLNLMLLLSSAWGARLTFNFARKGGYAKGGEDYRWAELRRRWHPALYQVFNFFFIAGFQHALLLAIALPAFQAFEHRGTPLSAIDLVAALLFTLCLVLETLADEQQWRFHQDKKAKARAGSTPATPFLTQGLFRYSRHPNFFFEQAQWWTFYLFGVGASGMWLDETLLGCVVLTLLFHGSTNFTEELSLAKYPSYAEYQRRVPRLIPWFPK